MEPFNNQSIRLYAVVIFILILMACRQERKASDMQYSMELARVVHHVTTGMITADAAIEIGFVKPVIQPGQVESQIDPAPFRFDPPIDGKAFWRDRHTLVFQPAERLPLNGKYRGEVRLKDVLPEEELADIPEKLPLQFRVVGREVQEMQAEVQAVESETENVVQLSGEITFTEPVELSKLRNACVLLLDKQKLKLQWTELHDQRRFKFVGPAIKRSRRAQQLTMTVSREPLGISRSVHRTFKIPAAKAFDVTAIVQQTMTDPPALVVEFSEEPKPSQDLRGFIQIEPFVDFDAKIIGREVLLQGAFERGNSYRISIQPGIQSRLGNRLNQTIAEKVDFEDRLPKIRFTKSGVFLPSLNRQKIVFESVNVKQVYVKVIRVFASNLGQFLQMEALEGQRDRNRTFNYHTNRVGVEVAADTLELGSPKNRWVQHALDLSPMIQPDDRGLYLLSVQFEKEDMLYDLDESDLDYRRRSSDWYYNDPRSWGYLYKHGRIYKPVILSDIGLTCKKAGNRYHVFVNDVITTEPLSAATVRLMTFQNQEIAQKQSDASGKAIFRDVTDEVFYIEAEKNGQRSVVTPSRMGWNTSTFDTRGREPSPEGVNAFLYTDRDVHRPGDVIHLAAIIRNDQHTFPLSHPVQLQVFNPKNQLVYSEVNSDGKDGFYAFHIPTEPQFITGNYLAKLKAGSRTLHHQLHVETVVPERLKIQITPAKTDLSFQDQQLKIRLQSEYLFGRPASGLKTKMDIHLYHEEKPFRRYGDFMFYNESRSFEPIEENVYDGVLDNEGAAETLWKLPPLDEAPSAVKGVIAAEVKEPGGRASKNSAIININPYPVYVGIRKPELRYGYANTGTPMNIPVVLVNPEGQSVPDRNVIVRIFHNEQHWWWEYQSRERYRLRFKSDETTRLVKQDTLVSAKEPFSFTFKPQDRGRYLFEVQAIDEDGHSAACFISAYPWGRAVAIDENAGMLTLKTDQEMYQPGETARIHFPAPSEGSVLFTVEKGRRILESRWIDPPQQADKMNIAFELTEAMMPNVYASVSVIQPHANADNDRPMRAYGIVPVKIEDANTRQDLQLNVPERLRPKQSFTVEVQTANQKPTQLTLAVVDEGLLSLTQFETPQPWRFFNSRERLVVETADLFSKIIGVHRGDIYRTFSIGGGMSEAAYREQLLLQQKARRFEPVALFKGPVETDANGRAAFSFTMPNYVGAVRVMAVAANGKRYGHAEQTIAVKNDLMLLPTLPRVIGAGDRFELPVTVFNERGFGEPIGIELRTEGPLEVESDIRKSLNLPEKGQGMVYFTCRAKEAIGTARIKLTARAGEANASYETSLAVRVSAPHTTEITEKTLEPGQSETMDVPASGVEGSNQARISIQRRPNLQLNHRILWLIRYPYGCIEQMISSAFPQLYLSGFIPQSKAAQTDMDKHINRAIRRLNRFQLADGGFTYWPGNTDVSTWGSLYAGHFMLEAQSLGYHVPSRLLQDWVDYEKKEARRTTSSDLIQAYRAYVLALAEEPPVAAMNRLRENRYDELRDVEKWLLASAYKSAGMESVAGRIVEKAGASVQDYDTFTDTYGSAERDKAMILEQMIRFEHWLPADRMARDLALNLSSKEWYSTQSTGFMLTALGKYFKALVAETSEQPRLKGVIALPDDKTIPFDTDAIAVHRSLNDYVGKQISVSLDENSDLKRAFVSLQWSGLPLDYSGETIAHRLRLTVEWLDDSGMPMDIGHLEQGATFWQHIRVHRKPGYAFDIEELALSQILPAGWEIEHTRLSESQKPQWMQSWMSGQEAYRDIRDDRALWFFDLPQHRSYLDFVMKIRAVTAGTFTLPPTQVEAMYNHNFRAMLKGRTVTVRRASP